MSSSSAIHPINTLISMTTTTMTWLARVGGGGNHQHNDHNNNNNNSWILLSALFCSLFGVCIFLLAKRLTQQRQQGRRALRKGVQFGAMVGFWFQLTLCTALVTLYRSLASYWESSEHPQQQQASSLSLLLARVIFTPAIVPALAFVFLNTAYLSVIVMACRHSFNSYWTGALSAVSIQLGLWTGLGYALLQIQQQQDAKDDNDVDISENSTYMGLVVVVGLVPLMLLRLAQCCWGSSSQADEEFWSNHREEMSEPLLLLSEGRRQQQQKLAAADNKETEYDEATCCWKQNSGLAYVQQMGGLGYASLV